MKVTFTPANPPSLTFKDIKPKQIFKWSEFIYMKIEDKYLKDTYSSHKYDGFAIILGKEYASVVVGFMDDWEVEYLGDLDFDLS